MMQKLLTLSISFALFFSFSSCKKDGDEPSIYSQNVILNNANIFAVTDVDLDDDSTIDVDQFYIDELEVSNPKDIRMTVTGFPDDPVSISSAPGEFFGAGSITKVESTNMKDFYGRRLFKYTLTSSKELNFKGVPAGGSISVKKFTFEFNYIINSGSNSETEMIRIANAVMEDARRSTMTISYYNNNIPIAEPE